VSARDVARAYAHADRLADERIDPVPATAREFQRREIVFEVVGCQL
jgi:hypothetical protein